MKNKKEKLMAVAVVLGIVAFSAVCTLVYSWSRNLPTTVTNAVPHSGTAKGSTVVETGDKMLDAYYAASDLVIYPITAEHGEDYVIEWEDEGMEARVRYWLDKPEGDIYHSDVWDFQYISIGLTSSGTDVALKQPPEGYDAFSRASISDNNDDSFLIRYGSLWTQIFKPEFFPEIETLRDLRHFDSLQYFSAEAASSLAGIEECENLVSLRTTAASTEMLAPIAEMEQLQKLDIVISRDGTVGLDAIEGLPNLQKLTIRGQPASWQPLGTLPKLNCLELDDCTNPDLEPLTATPIEYLDLSLGQGGTNYDALNYEPVSRMEKLVYLDLTNNSNVQAADVQLIIDGAPDLQHLSINYTPAAQHAGEIDASKLTVFKANIP